MTDIVYTGKPPKKEIFQIFSETMSELIKNDSQVVYIDADLMSSMRAKDLQKDFPNNVFNTGIQEANMIGVAAGMFLHGRKPYVHSFAPFASRRCFDQIYVSIGYAQKSIRIIGSEPGICATDNGGTHMTFEDIALMRSIPGATIIDVSDGGMFGSLLETTKDMTGVIYFRTPRRNLPDIYADNVPFEIGKGKALTEVKEKPDATIIATGIMVGTALEVFDILRREDIYVTVIDPVTVKPLDEDLILSCAKKTKKIVTVENHSIYGGLGGAVAELLSEKFPVPMKRIGIKDEFGQVGSEEYLRQYYHLTAQDVANEVKSFINS